jgi:LPXTG-site transpeptidase (sortase) family protein
MRRLLGVLMTVAGAFVLSLAATRYAQGALAAGDARQEWDERSARAMVAFARSYATHHERVPLVQGAPVARLVIPKIDLDEIVLEGVESEELNAGPGHLPGSPLPGERGNAVISAHRDRHFKHFDAIDVGDTITTESGARQDRWVVISTRVVDANAPAIVRTSDRTLTLTTCWPIRYVGTAPERLIVTAKPAAAVVFGRRRAAAPTQAAEVSP